MGIAVSGQPVPQGFDHPAAKRVDRGLLGLRVVVGPQRGLGQGAGSPGVGAAEQVGHHEMARALVLLEACSARLIDLVFDPLQKELLGAIKVPMPPVQRISGQLGNIRAVEQMATAAAAQSLREIGATRPSPALVTSFP